MKNFKIQEFNEEELEDHRRQDSDDEVLTGFEAQEPNGGKQKTGRSLLSANTENKSVHRTRRCRLFVLRGVMDRRVFEESHPLYDWALLMHLSLCRRLPLVYQRRESTPLRKCCSRSAMLQVSSRGSALVSRCVPLSLVYWVGASSLSVTWSTYLLTCGRPLSATSGFLRAKLSATLLLWKLAMSQWCGASRVSTLGPHCARRALQVENRGWFLG